VPGSSLTDAAADVVVIGDGLTGLTAAARLAGAGRRCTVLGGAAPGGLLLSIESVQGLPEHPDGIPGYDLGPIAQEAAMEAGADCRASRALTVAREGPGFVVSTDSGTLRARAVVLAPGCTLRTLGVDGEARLVGKGVSHCASCDAPLLRGRSVAVVGGGDAACQEALTIARHAGTVHLLVRGDRLRARPEWQQRVAGQARIQVRYGVRVDAILGDTVVTGLRLAGVAGPGDTLAVDAVFIYAGLVPDTGWLGDWVPREADGHLVVDDRLCTPLPGLFAAGSARAGSNGQAAQAIDDGHAAADAALAYFDACGDAAPAFVLPAAPPSALPPAPDPVPDPVPGTPSIGQHP
jgi:thioredoxin reductase (NADPH)